MEILPFPIRAKGFNVFSFAVSLSLIFNQYANPIALGNCSFMCSMFLATHSYLERIGWKYYLVYVCWLAFEFAFLYICMSFVKLKFISPNDIILVIVETKGRTLEETAALFDGEEATEKIVDHAIHEKVDEKVNENLTDSFKEKEP